MPRPPLPALSIAAQVGLAELLEQSAQFGGMARAQWCRGKEGAVFLRVNHRALPHAPTQLTPVVDLANVELLEKYRGQGVFRALLDQLEQTCVATGRTLYVENVLSDRLHDILSRRGYQARTDLDPVCYWKSPAQLEVCPRTGPRLR